MNSVIIVDDDLKIVKELLEKVSWKTLKCEVRATADNAIDGLVKIKQLEPDIVITDIHMPGCTGLEMIHYLSEHGFKGNFIIITAYEIFEEARLALQYGVSDFLVKPIDKNELEASIKKILINHSRRPTEPIESNKADAVYSQLSHIRNQQGSFSPAIRQAMAYIDSHIYSELSLTVLCEEVGLSSAYFSRLFKKETGVGFLAYVQMVKMHQAKKLLMNSRNKVYEVAEMLGYHDYTYFFQVFKKQYGFSPRDVQRHLGKI